MRGSTRSAAALAALAVVALNCQLRAATTSLTFQSTTGIAGITSWPLPFNDATTTNPSTFTVPEGTYTGNGVQPQPPATPGPTNSLAQSWTSTATGPLGHVQIAVTGTGPINLDYYLWKVTGGIATDNGGITYGTVPPGGTNITVPLLGTSDTDNDPNNAATSDSSVYPLYTVQGATAAVLDFDFTAENIALVSGTQYIFEIASDTSLTGMPWFRSVANGLTGQAFRNRGSLNGNNARDMTLAASVVPEPATLSLGAIGAVGLLSHRRRTA